MDIDHQDGEENTALHHALRGFINAERDPNRRDKYKNFVESLLRKGTKLDIKNNKNETPFDLLVNYVEKGIFDKAQRLTTVLELLDKCENKDALKELIPTFVIGKTNGYVINLLNFPIIGKKSSFSFVLLPMKLGIRCKDGTPALDKLKKLESDFN